MNRLPMISVIIVNNNGLKYLKETIPVILQLSYPNCEIIVVDNGSTDGSLDYIKVLKQIRLIQSPRFREKNFACNFAIDQSYGEYILLLDNDCIITDPDILQNLTTTYNGNDRCGIIGLAFCDSHTFVTPGYGGFISKTLYIANGKPVKLAVLKKFHNQLIGFPHGLALFIKKSVWNELGGYDTYLKFGGDDNDIGIKSWLFGYKNYLYSRSIQIHIGQPERQDNNKYSIKFKEMLYAHLYTIVKNFTLANMLVALTGHTIFMFFKSIKQSIFRLHPGPFFAFFSGFHLFMRNLRFALKKRQKIQFERVVKNDVFLKIKPIEFDK